MFHMYFICFFRKDYEKMRTRPQPRNGKRVGNEVWFDVKLSPPLGLALDTNLGVLSNVVKIFIADS